VFSVDVQGRLQRCNKATIDIYDCAPEKLLHRHFLEMVHPTDFDIANNNLRAALSGAAQNFEARFLTDSGEIRYAIFNSAPLVNDSQPNGALWFVRDITEQKRALELAAQADKLRALGKLASGVAHDFNNGLAAILGRIQLLQKRTTDEATKRDLQIIQTAAEDAAMTVKRIQTFARQTPSDNFERLDVAALVRDSIEIMRTRWENEAQSRGVKYAVEFVADESFYVLGNASELREVFINLIVNALDAMPGGGWLLIKCLRQDERVLLSFTDTGAGMEEEVRERIFEPFFTTKGVQGTGLGLSVSYSIIEAHGGHITVESNPNKGSIFTIELSLDESTESRNQTIKPNVVEQSKMSILVVDDEDFVREALADMLTVFEHEVVAVGSAREALSKMDSNSFDVVFTDLSMPEMDGWQLAREIRRRHHEIPKIVMVTGYGKGVRSESEQERKAINAVIGKPFDFEQLNNTLAQLQIKN
jgi:PAS domain S-box-containing protein